MAHPAVPQVLLSRAESQPGITPSSPAQPEQTQVLAPKPCLILGSSAGRMAEDQKRHLLFA